MIENLHIVEALRNDRVEALESWLQQSPSNREIVCSLQLAILYRSYDVAFLLLRAGAKADPTHQLPQLTIQAAGEKARNPIALAIAQGQKGIDPLTPVHQHPVYRLIEQLIAAGFDPHGIEESKRHPLGLAVELGSCPGLQAILQSPTVDINRLDGFGETALETALACHRPAIAKILVERGGKLRDARGGGDAREILKLAQSGATHAKARYQKPAYQALITMLCSKVIKDAQQNKEHER